MSDCVLRFPATLDAFAGAFTELANVLDDRGLQGRCRYSVELVFEEVVANIIRHGERLRVDPHFAHVELALGFEDEAVVMCFSDDGVPFDPRTHVASDDYLVGLGGLGIKLVRHVSSSIDYERTEQDRNRLVVTVATA